MTTKTIHEIQEEHGRRASAILMRRFEEVEAIREANTLEAGAYLDHLTPEGRMNALREHKAERAEQLYTRTREDYTAELERYQAEERERKERLEERLFGTPGAQGADALSRTILASEGELAARLDVAAHAGNQELGRAVFVAADRKGLGDLMARYFEHLDPEARGLYAEWRAVTPPEVHERQRENLDALIPPPDRGTLIPPLRAHT
jgi:hypothetical protein